MPTITIRDVPEITARKLKARAERNHRSLQGEILLLLEEAISAGKQSLSIDQLWERGRALGLSTRDDSVEVIRKLRDERFGR